MSIYSLLWRAGLTAALFSFQGISAKVSEAEAARLDSELTPVGAIRSGNADGTIPAWDGGITMPPEGYRKGMHHINPYAGEEPRLTITAENYEEHTDKLSAGHIEMFKRYPNTWKMHIYPTHRSASYPDWIYNALRRNAVKSELANDGNGIKNAESTSPFPIPQNGLEAVWNHLVRWVGGNIDRVVVQVVPTAGGTYETIKFRERILNVYGQPGVTSEKSDNILYYFYQKVLAPPRAAGRVLLVHETLDQNRQPRLAWLYNPGIRRVRRAPNIAFDNPGTEADSQRTTDDFQGFNGSPERYNWELKGRKEMYIPYNAYGLSSDKLGYNELVNPGHLNPEHLRYELHRVWVVEATVKDGTNHIYARRTMYLDEDSWSHVLADLYDSRGNIWRVTENHTMNYYEVPVIQDTVQAIYDLQNGRYVAFGMNNKDALEEFGGKMEPTDFTPQSLRKEGRR